MRLPVFALACVATAVSFGSTIRHDRADSLYTTLDNQAPFSSVGRVNVTGGLGSGTYIGFGGGSHWVLTAAHVASNISQNPTFNVTGTNIAVTQVIAFSGWGLNNNDFSLLRLASNPGVAAVPFYNGALELGRDTVSVGYGATGTGLTGINAGAGTRRAFENVADFVSTTATQNVIYTDFDNPINAADNVLGSAIPRNLEGNVAGGDSGGGLFGNFGTTSSPVWRLIGVTSTLAWVDGTGDADYGDLSGYARIGGTVPTGANWIQQNTGIAGVPEPGTMLVLGAGLAALARRRRRQA